MLFKISFLFTLFISSALAAENPTEVLEEIVVQGKRLPSDHQSATVWTTADLEREAGRPVGELLRETTGVDFTYGTSGNGGISIRGSTNAQALVIIDGVKANDPSAPNRLYDWTRLDVATVERIEILKGPQAVSYGSDAIGGVVLITTKRGRSGVSASLEGGSEGFARARGTLGLDLNPDHTMHLLAVGKGVFDGGPSALAAPTRPALDKNSREAAVGAELESRWESKVRSRISADLRAAHEEIDANAFDPDPNYIVRNREIRGGIHLERESEISWKALATHLDFRRAFADAADPAHSPFETTYRGSNSRAEFEMGGGRKNEVRWVLGAEATRETLAADSLQFPTTFAKDHADAVSVFGESSILSSGGLSADVGVRASHFSEFGEQWSGKAGVSYALPIVARFDLGISTGFKAPSLYNLYDPNFGNVDLAPEESVQIEAGLTVSPLRGTAVSLRGFQNRIRNRFGFDPVSFRSLNTTRAEVSGAELELTQRFGSLIAVKPHATYLSSKDASTNLPLTDVAKWKGGLKLILTPSRETSFTFSYFVKSARNEAAGTSRVAGFSRVDLAGRYAFSEDFSASARIENLLDRDYQEIRGYRTQGISGFVGVEYRSL